MIRAVSYTHLKLKTTVDPRKWICVGVDEAKVVSKGKLVCVVMDDENGDYYINNFKRCV